MKSAHFYQKIFSISWCIKCVILSLTLLGFNTMAQKSGAVGGGGSGLLIKVADSADLILWDIYSINPGFREKLKGDKIDFHNEAIGTPHSSQDPLSQYLQIKNLKSFQRMKEKVLSWRAVAPHFVSWIESNGFFDSVNPTDIPLGQLPFILTDLEIQNLDEVYVKQNTNFQTKDLHPTGYYLLQDSMENINYYNQVLINAKWLSQAGQVSQGGFFLHERMRQFQSIHNIENSLIQNIVAQIMTSKPRKGVIPDSEFENLVEKPSLFARCSNSTIQTPPEVKDFLNDFCKAINTNLSRHAQAVVLNAIKLNLLSSVESHPRLVNSGVNNLRDDGFHYYLEPAICKNIIKKFNDPHYFNFARWPFYCDDKGWLEGTGNLIFPRLSDSEFSLEMETDLYMGHDANSQLELHFFSNQKTEKYIAIHITAYPPYSWEPYAFYSKPRDCGSGVKCEDTESITINTNSGQLNDFIRFKNSNTARQIRVIISRKNKSIRIEMPADANVKWIELAIPENIMNALDGNDWTYNHANSMTTHWIRDAH